MSVWRNIAAMVLTFVPCAMAQQPFVPPPSPRVSYNFNPDWRFFRADVAGAEAVGFDDSAWQTVSTPHSFNDVDSFRTIISHGGGDRGTYKGLSWYRKHFKLPASAASGKVFIEFEGMRQAGDIYLNGKAIGLYENGVSEYGLDITAAANFGEKENVLAVKVDNRTTYVERATRTGFEWNANDFNPDHGGINRRVWLHLTGKIYQTLPLYYGLESTGVYVYPDNISIPDRTADITVESQVHNASDDRATVTLSAFVVDKAGIVRAKFEGDAVDMVAGEKTELTATGPLKQAIFWSDENPYLYDVYSVLTVDDKVVDVNKVTTGFRKTEFKGGVGTGGVFINDKFVYLKGYAQRSSNEWAAVGAGYPDWMHDYTIKMMRDGHANYVRWMHVSPQKADVESCDRFGIVQVIPGGDKERDVTGRQWDQRIEVTRAAMISFRNNPSVLFWEAGNTVVSVPQMQQMVDLRKQWDAHGGRVMGARGNDSVPMNTATTPVAEYYGIMIGQDPKTDALVGKTDMFRAYSMERRDRAPLIETEDFREEGARRFWDVNSPPHFGFKKGPTDTWSFNSDTFALAAARRYWAYWTNRISNTDPAHSKWSAYASIYFSDSDADGRQQSSEVCRVSGKVDAVRLPKDIYFTHRVMQSDGPDLHILGHWNYPAVTKKTVYVIANHVDAVELFENGVSKGRSTKPTDGYVYAFDNIEFQPGSIRAAGYVGDKVATTQEIKTAGDPTALKLTLHTGPNGLVADGNDVAFVDVEVVDAGGVRCPTDEARVDFELTGPGIWRGGYNSGLINTTNNAYLNTECGINRVFVRSTLKPGAIQLTARRPGLTPATITIDTRMSDVRDGLSMSRPQLLPAP